MGFVVGFWFLVVMGSLMLNAPSLFEVITDGLAGIMLIPLLLTLAVVGLYYFICGVAFIFRETLPLIRTTSSLFYGFG